MTEEQQGPTLRVRFREVSASTRCLLRGSGLYMWRITNFSNLALWLAFNWLNKKCPIHSYINLDLFSVIFIVFYTGAYNTRLS